MPSLIAGASLLVDYILTVAVSISAGVAAIVSIPAFRDLADQRVALGLVLIAIISVANLRGIKESGRIFSVPTYVYIVMLTILVGYGLYESFIGRDRARPVHPGGVRSGSLRRDPVALHHPQGLLVRRGGADRCRGDLERRAGVPSARVEERRRHPRGHGAHPRDPVLRRVAARAPGGAVPEPRPDRLLPDGSARLRQRADVPGPAVRDRGDPHARGEHGLRRLPSALVDHRQGRLPAPAARQPWRPARVLERRAGPGGHGRAADHRLRRSHQRADPALRGRRVHVVHALAGGNGPPPPEGAGTGLAAQRRDQRRRLGRHLRRPAHRRHDEVQEWRMGADRPDPVDHPACSSRSTGTTSRSPRGSRPIRTTGRAR